MLHTRPSNHSTGERMNFAKLSPILAVFALTGCSWTGNIGSNFYTPEPVRQKINATIGLTDQFQPSRVQYGMSVDYSLGIDEYRTVLKKELSARFKEVINLHSSGTCEKCLLTAEPRIKLVIDQANNSYWGRLRVDFYERTGRLYTSIDVETTGSAAPNARLMQQSLATGATMGLLAPKTIDDYGIFLIAIGEQAVGELVWEAGRAIASSKDLSSKSIAYLDPARRQTLTKNLESARKELEKMRQAASVCTSKAVKVLDDEVSPVELIAIEAGKLCRSELLSFAEAVCIKDQLSPQECLNIQDAVMSRRYLAETITRQVLSNRNQKKRNAGPTTIIVPLAIPEAIPVPVPVPESSLKKMPTKPSKQAQILM